MDTVTKVDYQEKVKAEAKLIKYIRVLFTRKILRNQRLGKI